MLKHNVTSSRTHETKFNSIASSKRPQPPSLALSNVKGSAQLFASGYDRRSPIGSEREAARESEPQSARSRSQFESTSLTPTSFSNDSELSAQQASLNFDQRRWQDPFASGPSRERTNTWLDAPEFQPSLPIQQQNLVRYQARELSKMGHGSSNETQVFDESDYEILDGWNSYEQDGSLFERNAFRPVLSSVPGVGRPSNYASSLLPGNHNVQEVNTSFARLSMNRDTRQQAASRNEGQKSSLATNRYPPFDVQDRQYEMSPVSGVWNGRAYAHIQSFQNADPKPFRQDTEESKVIAMNGSGNTLMQQQRNLPMPLLPNQSQLPNVQYRYRNNDHQLTDTDIYSSHTYNAGLYNVNMSSTSLTGYKSGSFIFDPTLGNTYESYGPGTRTQPEPSQAVRSPLLEEFRIHGRTKKYELKDIFGHIVEFSGDQLGSRFIQHKLEVANSEEKDRVFQEIASDCRQLMTDLFGNYVIQKLFEHGNQSQKKILAGHMKGHMMALSTQTYGCRVVQKALDHVLTDQQASLVRELDGHVLKVVDDQNGNHVIQKAIECIPGEHIQFIVDAHRGHVHSLSKHAYGCRVIQRMLEHCQPQAKRAILDELHSNIGDLIQDPFGNYVVQHVIVNGESQDRRPVIEKVQSRLLENAMHKFASNVVEKALDYAEEDQSRMMLQTLTSRDEQGQSQIIKLLSHQYGNYVIRKHYKYTYSWKSLTFAQKKAQPISTVKHSKCCSKRWNNT